MKLIESKEKKGNLAFKVCWISLAGQYSELKFDTKKEIILHIEHLKKLGYRIRDVAVYKHYEVL